jgi:hypothetical protein
MTRITAAALLLALASAASAQPLPVAKVGPCPSGYAESGGYCAPTSGTTRPAVPKIGQCASGWTQSGAYCVNTRPQQRGR